MESRALRLVEGTTNIVERSGPQRDAAKPLQTVADPVAVELEAALALRRTGADAKALRRVLRRIEELLDEIGSRPSARARCAPRSRWGQLSGYGTIKFEWRQDLAATNRDSLVVVGCHPPITADLSSPDRTVGFGAALATGSDMRWLSLLPFVAACFPGSPAPTASATLADFTELTIFVNDSSFKVLLGDYYGAYCETGPCSVVGDDLTADLDGVPIPVVSRGAQIGTTAGDDVNDNVCQLPTLELDMPPPQAVSTLTIADARTTVVCTVPGPSAQAQQAVICSPHLNARVFRSPPAAITLDHDRPLIVDPAANNTRAVRQPRG